MKYLKKFENKSNLDLFKAVYNENPVKDTHDFYWFIGKDEFKENPPGSGNYKKTIYIEKMIRITPDENSISNMQCMQMRAKFQSDSKLYDIWLPNEIREDVENKGSESIEDYIIYLISQHKQSGDGDEQGKNIYKNVKQRLNDTEKFGL